jgi:hypothetical protein
MARITGINAKIARAREHLNTLEDETQRFFKPDSYIVAHEIEPESRDQIWRLKSDLPEVPIRISIIVGDVLYNLRSALDHLAWQLVLANGDTPDRRTAFPILRDPSHYYTRQVRDKIRGMSPEAKTSINSLQPCNGGYSALWDLAELSDVDKHRHLNIVVMSSYRGAMGGPSPLPPMERMTIHTGLVERDAILLRVQGPDVDVDFRPTFEIVVSDG